MKNLKYVFAIGLGMTLLTACSSSASDDFEEINEGAKKKRLKTITATNQENETMTAQFMYNSENKLVSLSGTDNEGGATLINYKNDGNTIAVSEGGSTSESFSIEKLYESPYEAYETGEVLEYDSNKNPSKVLFRQEVYDWETDTYSIENYIAEMFYDENPNMYFSTLEAAGIIDILDGVDINFGINPQAAEIVKARALFPVNNLTKVIYKDADDNIKGTLTIDYTYDEDGYPVKGSGLVVGEDESVKAEVNYSYDE
ncbi:hypothetical protein [uncultured Tenacibaculum sp.]|uniref:hypothetical protein n=1 Tax=uncultured Tenacibaculum sp. TaxID=174713 RepID=UPI002610648B|nr:hypothetical protein [uncultured Tenacibaculum sp.]